MLARSMILSSLKLPPVPIDMIATFWSLDPEISLLPSVAIEVTCTEWALIVLATVHSLFQT